MILVVPQAFLGDPSMFIFNKLGRSEESPWEILRCDLRVENASRVHESNGSIFFASLSGPI